ncbi:hypothetical protein CN553_12500 [Bacillus cereus]|uniref:Uncharacterized protein n=1 Tax=Bacillus cereus TaxID=1396 RepID=A0A9X6UC50_BACCE|nr:hypothetical protein [Bacillus cereus]PEN97850.1 hypothetical protein CN553_12500 [Bacillus cereus]
MIIGYNFFNYEHGGTIFDTPVCTDMMDELNINEGTYDEIYIDLNTQIANDTAKPFMWTLTTIMDSKFTGDLDAGSIGAEGFKVTHIQLYRSVYGSNKWDLVAQFDYNKEYNVYNYVDRYVQNGATYQYAIVPVANEVIGDMLKSDQIKSEYEGIFLTDRKENKRLEYDISLGDVTYNQASSVNQPINGAYPIVTFGNSNYRSGNLSTLPLSRETIAMAGGGIDKLAEQINRQDWLDFLNNHKAKVLRMDSGVLILVATQNVSSQHKEGALRDLASVTFDYTEIGELNFSNMLKNDLISTAELGKFTFNDEGEIESAI